MTTKKQGGDKERLMLSMSFALLMFLFGAWLFFLTEPDIRGQVTYNSTSLVNTTVNITNSAPLIYYTFLDSTVNLVAYNNKTVYCNVTVFDFDNDTIRVNATFYINGTTAAGSPDDGNNHYSNTSCTRATAQDRLMNYTCVFNVRYYANNNTRWLCNATAIDVKNSSSTNISNLATVNPLVAIKMDELLDYGNLEVNQISNDTIANITNAGNRDANISVKGYGAVENDGFAFICSFGTIAINYERYNITATSSSAYSLMTQLTGTSSMIGRLYVPQRVSESADSTNATYWRLQIPVGAGGICNGKILFTASDRGN